jgi:WD40 repeat protein
MHIAVVTLSGRELASFDAEMTWGKREICERVRRLRGSLMRSARLVCESTVLSDQHTLADLDLTEPATITIVIDVHHADVLLTASDDHTAALLSAETCEKILALVGHNAAVSCVAMTPDAALVVTADSTGVAKVWDCGAGDCVLTVRAANEVSGIDGVAIAESRALFATASMAENAATVWSLESGEPVRVWHHPEVRRVGFSPSGRFVMTVSFGGSQMMWDLDSGDCVRTINDREITLDVAFSIDGELMLLSR